MEEEVKNETVMETPAESKVEEKKEVPAKFKKLIEEVETMSVLDLHELVKALEDRFGVSAQAMAAPAAAAGDSGDDDGGGLVTITLEEGGPNKIQAIKVVKEAVDLVLRKQRILLTELQKFLKRAFLRKKQMS